LPISNGAAACAESPCPPSIEGKTQSGLRCRAYAAYVDSALPNTKAGAAVTAPAWHFVTLNYAARAFTKCSHSVVSTW